MIVRLESEDGDWVLVEKLTRQEGRILAGTLFKEGDRVGLRHPSLTWHFASQPGPSEGRTRVVPRELRLVGAVQARERLYRVIPGGRTVEEGPDLPPAA